jgi:hypothetical protein
MTPQPEATIAKPTPNSHGNPKTKLKNLPRPRLDVRECVYVHSTYRTTGTDTRSDTRGHAAVSQCPGRHTDSAISVCISGLPKRCRTTSRSFRKIEFPLRHKRTRTRTARSADRQIRGPLAARRPPLVVAWRSFASTTFNDCYSSTKPPLLWRTASATSRSHSGALALYLGPSWH